jgi:hypothetical protein
MSSFFTRPGKEKKKAPGKKKPAGKKTANGNARKRAAAYSSLYRDDKKGVEVVKPLRIKQPWPDPPSSGEKGEGSGKKKKLPSKDVIIAKLLSKDGFTRKDAIQKVYGADVIDDRVVRGIIKFSQPTAKSGKVKKKRVVTPKGFWSVKLDYSELMSNYNEGFRGLREKRLREGVDIQDLVEWADIKEFRLYIDLGTGDRGPVPLDSRKATDLLTAFSPSSSSPSPGKGKGRKRKLSFSSSSGERNSTGNLPKAIEQLKELTADAKYIECASNAVKDQYILPSLSRQEEALLAQPIAKIVDDNCPDGVNMYLTVKDISSLEEEQGWFPKTIVLDTDQIKDGLQRVRCQYECDIPTHEDLLMAGRIHLRDPKELERGNHIVQSHAAFVGDAVNMIAKASLKAKGIDIDAIMQDAAVTDGSGEPSPPPEEKKKEVKKKRKTPPKKKSRKEEKKAPPSPLKTKTKTKTEPKWLEPFAYIKVPLVTVFRQMHARILKERGSWFYNEQITHVAPILDALIQFPCKDAETLPDDGLDMMLAMVNAAKRLENTREFCSLVFYFCYFTFLHADREQALPWYVEPVPPKEKKKKKGKRKRGEKDKLDIDDLLGGGGLWFKEEEEEEEVSEKEQEIPPEQKKQPTLYDEDPVYSKSSNWAEMDQDSATRRKVFRLDDERQVAIRLCAAAKAITRDGRDKTPKEMNTVLRMDSITTVDELEAHPVFQQPKCFWLWMAVMHELFLEPLSSLLVSQKTAGTRPIPVIQIE